MPGVEHTRNRQTPEPQTQTAFLVFDTESIPDGRTKHGSAPLLHRTSLGP